MKRDKNEKMIFVIGTGRSGTHWLGYILGEHPDVRLTVEKPSIFGTVKKMALDPFTRSKLFPKLMKRYNRELSKADGQYYVDKSHPNIWLAEALANVYPDAIFVGIQRNPYATIASMLVHKDILKWQNNWEKYPHPNEFLGTNYIETDKYSELSPEEKAAYRWLSHKNQLEHLQTSLGSRLHVIQYEELISQTEKELKTLGAFIGLGSEIPLTQPKQESLDKWKSQLNASTCEKIQAITGVDYRQL